MMVRQNTSQESQVRKEMSKTGRIRKVVNLRMLVLTLIVLSLIIPVSYAWHAYQVHRTSTALLEQAETLEKEKKWGEAASYLDRYLQIRPNDMSVWIRLAEDFDKSVSNPSRKISAINRYNVVLGKLGEEFPADKKRLQRRLVALLLEAQPPQYDAAEILADELLESDLEDAAAWRAKALALYHSYETETLPAKLKFDLRSVSEAFERAVKLNPTDTVLNWSLALIYRERAGELLAEDLSEDERKQKADAQIDALVNASSDDADIYLIRYQYRRTYQLDGAEADLQRALELGPDKFEVCIAAGASAQFEARRLRTSKDLPKAEAEAKYKEKYKEADKHYKHAIKIHPQLEQGYIQLGNLYREQSQLDDAIATWKEGLQRTSEQSFELNAILADALIESGQPEQAEKALDRIDAVFRTARQQWDRSKLKPLEAKQNLRRGQWHLAKGEFAEAIPLLHQATIDPEDSPEEAALAAQAWLMIGRSYGALNQWEEAAQAYEKALEVRPNDPRQHLLVGKLFESEKKFKQAESALRKATELAPDNMLVWSELFRFYIASEQKPKAEQLLTTIAGNTKLEELPRTLAVAKCNQLLGRTKEAETEYCKAAKMAPNDPQPLLALAELALRQGDYKSLEKWETQLKQVEGETGSAWKHYRARRLLVEAKDSRDPLLKEASELAAEIRAQQPKRSTTFLLAGLIAERKGELDGAIAAYRQAMELGDRSVFIYTRLVRLLIGAGQIEEADKLLAEISSQIPLSNDLTTAKMLIYSQQAKPALVLEVAQKAREARPNDPQQHLLVGRLFESDKKYEQAENAFQKATELAPDNLGVMGELFRFYVASKQQEKAEQVLKTIAGNAKLDETQRTLAVAACQQLLGRVKEAETEYRKAAKMAPDNLVAQGQLVRFLLSQPVKEKWEEAAKILQGLAEKNPDSALTRRALASVKASMGSAKDRKEASDLLETLVDNPEQATDVDHRYLAGLYESQQNIESAKKEYLKLIDRDDAYPRDMAFYVQFLLRNRLAAEATPWLDRLEKQAPEDAGIVALRVRWLHAQGRDAEIGDRVEKMVARLIEEAGDDQTKQMQTYGAAGNLYVTVGQFAAAEKHFRKILEKSPQTIIPLVNAVALQGRRLDAIKLCIEAAKNDNSPNPAVALSSIMRVTNPSKEELALSEPLLNKAVETHKDDAALLSNMAILNIIQGHTDKAVGLYKRVLETQPNNTVILNNLATILGDDANTRAEALTLVNRAIEIAGPQPNLQDTKATILLYDDKPSEAVELLEKATATADPDPRYFFHLALAYQKTGKLDKAREVYEQAEKRGLKDNILTTKGRELLGQLEADLKKK